MLQNTHLLCNHFSMSIRPFRDPIEIPKDTNCLFAAFDPRFSPKAIWATISIAKRAKIAHDTKEGSTERRKALADIARGKTLSFALNRLQDLSAKSGIQLDILCTGAQVGCASIMFNRKVDEAQIRHFMADIHGCYGIGTKIMPNRHIDAYACEQPLLTNVTFPALKTIEDAPFVCAYGPQSFAR